MRSAAALPLSAITAWEGLVDRAGVHARQTVLIHAGAGGVGHIAVQIAHAFGSQVFATVSSDMAEIVTRFGATAINYKALSVEEYLARYTGGAGFDVVYDTVGGKALDDSFASVCQYTGHVLSCLGWGTHSLAPLSFRGATYSGVFTLFPLITGKGRAHHGEILAAAARLADDGKLKPLLSTERFDASTIGQAHALVASGSLGKVVVEF
jgi:NADPH:quinone reductase